MRRTRAFVVGLLAAATAVVLPAVPANAAPYCDRPNPPPICNEDPGDPPPPPPPPSDKSPVGALESYQYLGGAQLRVSGWASDANGGPVRVRIRAYNYDYGLFYADQYHAGRGGWVGFSTTVPIPGTYGTHEFCAYVENYRDWTTPVAADRLLGCHTYKVEPPAPTDLTLSASTHYTQSTVRMSWLDNSWNEQRYQVSVNWIRTVYKASGPPERIPERRDFSVAANPGSGRVYFDATGLPANTFFNVIVNTVQDGRFSPAATGSVKSPE
ncbi:MULTISPECIES: hypothetical protein [Polymorphospora]|uniref:Fibronectin type-III domain-containing protein n=1 Tax=Polymorphospora lycopeni TaxID=3140240 RepID=A0ABV5CJ14_9ACTN